MLRRTHTAIYTNSHTYRGTNPSGLPACLLPLLRLIKHPFFMCRTQRNGCGPMYPCFHPAFFFISLHFKPQLATEEAGFTPTNSFRCPTTDLLACPANRPQVQQQSHQQVFSLVEFKASPWDAVLMGQQLALWF